MANKGPVYWIGFVASRAIIYCASVWLLRTAGSMLPAKAPPTNPPNNYNN